MGRTAVIHTIQGFTLSKFQFQLHSYYSSDCGRLSSEIFLFISGKFMAWGMIMERVGKIKILWVDSSFKHFHMEIYKRYLSKRLNFA